MANVLVTRYKWIQVLQYVLVIEYFDQTSFPLWAFFDQNRKFFKIRIVSQILLYKQFLAF